MWALLLLTTGPWKFPSPETGYLLHTLPCPKDSGVMHWVGRADANENLLSESIFQSINVLSIAFTEWLGKRKFGSPKIPTFFLKEHKEKYM